MQIAVVSDTHGQMQYTRAAIEELKKYEPELVIHCGDIGSPSIVPLFDQWPTHFVFGNVDFDERELRESIEISGQTCHERWGSLSVGEKSIAFLHSDDSYKFRETVQSGEWDLVCYGHTHKAETHRENGTVVLNPGAIYRADPHSIAIVDLPSLDVTHIEL